MLDELCSELRNYFCRSGDKHFGTFIISGGAITPLDFLKDGQYFRVVGSTFNDGVYQYPTAELTDETFDGAVWAMHVPPAFVKLSQDIDELQQKIDSDFSGNGYSSESYPNGYSYQAANDLPIALKQRMADIQARKARWRKL